MPSQAPLQQTDKENRSVTQDQTPRTHDRTETGHNPGGNGVGQMMNLQQLVGNQASGKIMQQKLSFFGFGKSGKSGSGTPGNSNSSGSGTPSNSGSGQPSAPQKSPEDVRREAIDADRDKQAPAIAKQLFDDILASAGKQAMSFLSNDKSTGVLRDSLKDSAVSTINQNINMNKGANKEQKSDAKQYTAANVDKAGIVNASLQKYTNETVPKIVTSDKKSSLENAAKAAYNKTAPDPKKALDKQLIAAQAQAKKSAKAEATRITSESVAKITQKMSDQIKQDAGFLDSKVDVGDVGDKELDKRQQLDAGLVKDSDIQTVYQNKLFEPIKQAVVMKFGVGRGAWRRSKELNKFRQQMKDSAREQANSDIDNQLDSNAQTMNKSALGKKYFGMLAKTEAHSMSKESVDETMNKKADDITKKVLPAEETRKALKDAAKTSAYAVARENPLADKKIRENALSGARTKAIELLKVKQTEAVNEARLITKGDKATSSGPDTVQRDDLSNKVKEQVKQDNIGSRSIKQAVEADSLNSGLGKIGKIVDISTPNAGDSCSFDFELKIPVYHGSYVLFGIAGSSEREKEELSFSSEFTFGAGFQTFGLDANFRIGLFLEAQGNDSQSTMNLISYGLYRQMRIVAPKAADFFWGKGGKSGMEAIEEAELWAAMIEEQDMKKEGNYVDVGMTSKLKADINAGVAKMGGAIGYKRLNRFDKERVQGMNGNKFGDTTDLTKLQDKAEALTKGNTRHVLELEGEATVKLGGNDVGFSLEGSVVREGGQFRAIEISATGSIPFVFGEVGGDWAKIASKFVTPGIGMAKNLLGIAQNKWGTKSQKKDLGKKTAGSILDTGTDTLFVTPPFEEVGAGFAEKLQGDETINDTVKGWLTGKPTTSEIETANKISTLSALELSVSFSKEWDKTGKAKEWEIAFQINHKKGFEVDAGVAKVSVEKSSRLGKVAVGKEDGNRKVDVELLGFEKSF